MAARCVSHSFFQVTLGTLKSWMVIYLYLLWINCYYTAAVTGQHQVIGSSQDILVKVGGEVVLPCRVEPPVNMGRKTVEWSRPDLKPYLVHLLQDGHFKPYQDMNPQYRERTSLFPAELPNGNMSLKLTSVRLSDEGEYRCNAPHLYSLVWIKLRVGSVSQPNISSNGPTDDGVSLSCGSGCWYPEPEMSWLDADGNNITAGPSVMDRPSQHCYIVQRNVTVRTAGHVTCRVHLPLFNHTVETKRYISESDIPTERGSTGAVVGWIVTLIIIIVAAGLGYLYWKKKKQPGDVKVTHVHEEMTPLMNAADQPMTYSDLITNDEEIRIVMVGKTGAGKSASGNTILGREAFTFKFSPKSVTKTCNMASAVVAGRKVSVIDTPGLFDTGFSNTETIKEVSKCITCAAPGPHVFLAVIHLGRFTDEERKVVAKIQKEFGQSSDKYTMILFTHGDELKGSIEEFVNDKLKQLISKYSGRYHVFNNESKDPSQVTELLEKINQMVKENGGSHYTNQMFQEEARRQALLVKTSGRPITDYEEQLQHNMDSTYLSVKLGTKHEMFENINTLLYNVDTVTDIPRHHEVRQMERKTAGEEKEIQISEIFKDPSGRNKRTVLTVGWAGIGKTFLVHKFISDWAKKCFPQDPHLVFPLKFCQLNLLKGQNFSLAKLIHKCIEVTQGFIEEEVLNDIFNVLQKSGDSAFKVRFVMSDLDESNFQLNFKTDFGPMSVTDSYPVEVLLVNLIKGELLPSAQIWITSRPAAANQIPKTFVNGVTEVRGFITDDQKMEYFKKRFMIFSDDEDQASSKANLIMSHIKESSIIRIMCEIPDFCFILATVVQNMGAIFKLPKTLTEMLCHFLMGEIQREKMKNPALDEADKEKIIKDAGEVLLKLGRLAFDQLDKGNIIFYQEDLEESGLDVNDLLLNSFFKEDNVFFEQTVYSFVHLSIQEFLAAVYLFHCFTQRNMEVLETFLRGNSDISENDISVRFNSDSSLSDFLKAVTKKSQQSESGHLDLFVRFLHGLSLQSNQSLLGLVGLSDPAGQTDSRPEEIQKAINNLKEMNDHKISPDRCVNIFHCLMEMQDHSVHQEIQQYLESEDRSKTQCSALASTLLMSEEVLDELDLQKYDTSNDGGPAVRNSTAASLNEEQQTSQCAEREETTTDRAAVCL